MYIYNIISHIIYIYIYLFIYTAYTCVISVKTNLAIKLGPHLVAALIVIPMIYPFIIYPFYLIIPPFVC